jgi:hypothetical protein
MEGVCNAYRTVIAGRRGRYFKAARIAGGSSVGPLASSIGHKAEFVRVFAIFETFNMDLAVEMAKFGGGGVQFKDAPLFNR